MDVDIGDGGFVIFQQRHIIPQHINYLALICRNEFVKINLGLYLLDASTVPKLYHDLVRGKI